MNYEQAKALLEEKGQTQLLKFYDGLGKSEQEQLLTSIANLDWSFEETLKILRI